MMQKKKPPKAADTEDWFRMMGARDDRKRRDAVKELYQMYQHEWRGLIEDKIDQLYTNDTADDLEFEIATDINVLWWAAQELGKIYAKPPTRSIDGIDPDPKGEDPLDPYLANGQLDLALDQASRLCYACRSVALRPLTANIKEEGEPDPEHEPHTALDVIPTHKIFAIPDKTDLTRLRLVVIAKDNGYTAWDKDNIVHTDLSGKVISEEPNPYGLIPYVVAHATYPTVDYWAHCDAYGLRDAAYMVAIAATEYNHLRRLQSHKQGWYRSDHEIPPSILVGPSNWLRVEGEGEAGLLDMQANLQEALDTLLDRAAATLSLYGIRPESVRGSLDASSGYALALKLISQEAAWEQQRRVWQVWEQRLFEVARRVLEVDAGIKLPEGQLKIDWAEIGAEATDMDRAELHKMYLDMGVVDVEWVQTQMGMTPEEIEQIKERKLENAVGAMIPPGLQPPGQQPPPPPQAEDDPNQRDDQGSTEEMQA